MLLLPVAIAEAGCISAIVVDGRVLLGQGDVALSSVPPPAGHRAAVNPACNDTPPAREPDLRTTVTTLRGIAPTVAVLERVREGRRSDRRELFVAVGSPTNTRAHPLHRALHTGRRRQTRTRRSCRPERRVQRGVLATDLRYDGFTLRRADRRVAIGVDARTRLTNRAATQPLLAGQRVALRTSVCLSRRVADHIAFAGPTVEQKAYEPDVAGLSDLLGPDERTIAAAILGVALAIALLGLAAFKLR